MIIEDYVSFEVARLLKEKGFDWDCEYMYSVSEKWFVYCKCNNSSKTMGDENYAAPALQMAMKWLRKEHNKIIVPNVCINDPISGKIDYYIVGIWHIPKNNGGSFCYTFPTLSTPYNGYSSYEEACEAGIKYCLENLL